MLMMVSDVMLRIIAWQAAVMGLSVAELNELWEWCLKDSAQVSIFANHLCVVEHLLHG